MAYQDSHHRLPNGARGASRSRVLVLVSAAVLLPIVGMIGLLIPSLLQPREPRTPTSQSTASGSTDFGPARSQPTTRPAEPTSIPVVVQPLPDIPPPPPRSEPELSLSLTSLQSRVFGVVPKENDPEAPGLLAAPIDQLYCIVGLQLRSEIPEPFTIRFGADVPTDATAMLATPAGATYHALGQVKPIVDMVHPFDTSPVSVKSGDAELQLVFLVPESLHTAELRLTERASLPLRIPHPAPAAGGPSLSGTWSKASRQNWSLRYQNPLLDAIRDENHTHLLVMEEKGTLRLEFPLAGITGTGSSIDEDTRDMYNVTLRKDDRQVTGVARIARQGSVLVFYLGAEPVYRFTYVRP